MAQRRILFLLAILLVGGSLSWTTAYAMRLRSDSYRREVEADLTAFFELPCEVGRIRGHTFSSRMFEDVAIWLPDRRDRVFACKQAIWQEFEDEPNPHRELDLFHGILALGSDRWVRDDYKKVLKSGLGHNFEDLDLTRVGLEHFEFVFDRGEVSLRCRDSSGTFDLSNPREGIARLHAYELNGYRVDEGVRISARFKPTEGVEVSQVSLSVPEMPLSALGMDAAIGGAVTRGRFAGNVQYAINDIGPELWIRGAVHDADLAELTRGVPMGPYEGTFSVQVDAARFAKSVATDLQCSGRITNLALAPLAPLLKASNLSGTATLDFDMVDLSLGHVDRMKFSGLVDDVSLQEWMAPLGKGTATGRMTIRINSVDLHEDAIKSADIEISVQPPSDEPGTIDRAFLLSVAQRLFKFTWPEALPEQILPSQVEYTQFGIRLLVRDNQLRVLGTHGSGNETILTVKVAGMSIGVVKQPTATIDLTPHIAETLERLRAYNTEDVREWWKRHRW